MLPSIGLSEMILLAVLAIIFVGPSDMPKMMRTIGRFVGKVKAMGQDFKDAFDEMGREAEIAELRQEIDDLKNFDRIVDLKEEAFGDDLTSLDTDIRESVALEHPRKTSAAPQTDVKGGDDGKT